MLEGRDSMGIPKGCHIIGPSALRGLGSKGEEGGRGAIGHMGSPPLGTTATPQREGYTTRRGSVSNQHATLIVIFMMLN